MKIHYKASLSKIFMLFFVVFSLSPFLVSGDTTSAPPANTTDSAPYDLLAPLPINNLDSETKSVTATSYIPGIVRLIIAVAGGLAVIKIIFAGIQYMSTDAFSGKSEAKTSIENALWGLGLAIGAFIILNTINPKLVALSIKIIPTQPPEAINGGDLGNIPSNSPDAVGCAGVCVQVSSSVPHKDPPAGCSSPGPCVVNERLEKSLEDLASRLKTAGIDWQVTEMYPPTREHLATCQQIGKPDSGKCVDAALRNINTSNIQAYANDVKKFMQYAAQAGLTAQFEVTTLQQKIDLTNAGVRNVINPTKSDGTSWITGNHFSLYLNGDF